MANNDNQPLPNNQFGEDTSLGYKDHQRFFDDYYDFKKDFNMKFNLALFDHKHIGEAFQALGTFISNNNAQLTKKLDFNTIKQKRQDIIALITKDKVRCLDGMENLFNEICVICMDLELEPKPVQNEDSEEVKFWKDESHKGLREIKKGFMDVLSIKNG